MKNRLAWAWCGVCYHLALMLPLGSRLWWMTVPNAGTYANMTYGEFCQWRGTAKLEEK